MSSTLDPERHWKPDAAEMSESPQAASALPPPEPQGRCERSSLATCSLPVSSASDLEAFVGFKFSLTSVLALASIEAGNRQHYEGMRDAYEDVLQEIRRQKVAATERQPEENNKVSRAHPEKGQ